MGCGASSHNLRSLQGSQCKGEGGQEFSALKPDGPSPPTALPPDVKDDNLVTNGANPRAASPDVKDDDSIVMVTTNPAVTATPSVGSWRAVTPDDDALHHNTESVDAHGCSEEPAKPKTTVGANSAWGSGLFRPSLDEALAQETADDAMQAVAFEKMLSGASRRSTSSRRSSVKMFEGVSDLEKRLQDHGVDTSKFGQGTAKTVQALHNEMYVDQTCTLEHHTHRRLKRIVSMVKIQLIAQDMFGSWMQLISTMQFLHDGRQRHRRDQLARMIKTSEKWDQSLNKVIADQLLLKGDVQDELLIVNKSSYKYEENEAHSAGYPGILTLYRVHRITVQVKNASDPSLSCIGLPDGRDFAIMEGVLGDANIGARLRMWTWEKCAPPKGAKKRRTADPTNYVRQKAPIPMELLEGMDMCHLGSSDSVRNFIESPSPKLQFILGDEECDWEGVQKVARGIRNPKYSLVQFFTDVTDSFPELKLFMIPDENALETVSQTLSEAARAGPRSSTSSISSAIATSGRTGEDEYQRTIGCLFAIYWLMRLDIDGKEGFTYGVDSTIAGWPVKSPPEPSELPHLTDLEEKRWKFYKETDWSWFTDLMVSAGLLIKDGESLTIDVERTSAMLTLSAVHDIMKVECLLPVVQEKHAPYNGYDAGVKINDHDMALGYILEKFPDTLPSFACLKPAQRKLLEFTQSKLEYNQGWLVQAEAPPTALFKKFKELVRSGGFHSSDVSFYFVHWLSDLAGAEPYPLEGQEKFVLYFPHTVLRSFLRSFPVVQRLAHKTETEVFEEYLHTRWDEWCSAQERPCPVSLSDGAEGIAMMRLLCQAQAKANSVLKAFSELPEDERELLSHEMSLTGCPGQSYLECSKGAQEPLSPCSEPRSPYGECKQEGPCFLVYYAPALLQKFGDCNEAAQALGRLCEVYRQARALWPTTDYLAEKGSAFVTIRIDTIKDLSWQDVCNAVVSGEIFVLRRHNDREAFVERHHLWEINETPAILASSRVLSLASYGPLGYQQGDSASLILKVPCRLSCHASDA